MYVHYIIKGNFNEESGLLLNRKRFQHICNDFQN